ncbi:branched-chain amino acid ABC transporter permease [Desulforamulus aquiferis]|uniref:Branched-chain amino acid ABC transporter permease n=1 Tax=Desulforamulus aquiferis TaxID=1397668 RepID=A0AAW7Z9H5_9FIRM|nr:branched-chain amino acid ABC transporter permease [Desulforamulus aquiferis]MDO7785759.1 branched-chain amino acid ABC transporter permease [Desulforamulus aquiferis]
MDGGLIKEPAFNKQLPFKVIIGLCLLFAALMAANFLLNGYYLRIVNLVGINIILVVSLNLTIGFTGIFSLGHSAFMAIGGYTVALLTMPIERKAVYLPDLPGFLAHIYVPFLPALIIGGLIAVICAYIIGYPVLKLRGHYLSVATLGFMVIVTVFVMNLRDITRGNSGLTGLKDYTNIWWTYAIAVITLYVIWRIINSSYGRSMLAIREDDLAAEAVGVNLVKIKLMSFAIGAFFAAVGGALYGHLLTMVSPNDFSYSMMFGLVVMLVIGGIGSIPGSVVGAVIVTLLPELFLNKLERGIDLFGLHLPQMFGVSQVLMSIALIVIIIFKPKGLLGK